MVVLISTYVPLTAQLE